MILHLRLIFIKHNNAGDLTNQLSVCNKIPKHILRKMCSVCVCVHACACVHVVCVYPRFDCQLLQLTQLYKWGSGGLASTGKAAHPTVTSMGTFQTQNLSFKWHA